MMFTPEVTPVLHSFIGRRVWYILERAVE